MDVDVQTPGKLRLTHILPLKDKGRNGIILRFYLSIRGGRGQHRAVAVRWGSPAEWKEWMKGLLAAQPAEPFTLRMIGLETDVSDMGAKYFGENLTALAARRILSERFFGRAESQDQFTKAWEKRARYFPASFGGSAVFDIADTEWHVEKVPPVTGNMRKKKRIIY